MSPDLERLRASAPDLALAGLVLLLGFLEGVNTVQAYGSQVPLVLVVLAFAGAVGLSRRAPGLSLAIVWVTCLLQVASGTPVLITQLTVAFVAFGTARWGSTATLWLSALSIPAAAVIAVGFAAFEIFGVVTDVIDYNSVINNAYRFSPTWQVGAAVLGMLVLGAPWLAGLALRFGSRAEQSRVSQVAAERDAARAVQESEQAREIARLREEQTRMARDVHDVVGHSLAVILAQAESAQYIEDADTERLKATMATIASSARTSLQDVRQVLTTTQGATSSGRSGSLDSLVEGVRSSGHEVVSTVVGRPQPLPPELETVAYRVLQEMLTNAIKHGRRDTPVAVERHWEGELRLEVRNVVRPDASRDAGGDATQDATPTVTQAVTQDAVQDVTQPIRAVPGDASSATAPAPGQGVEGMRRRLEAVGGRLDVRRRDEAGGQTFTATAWVPVRGGA
ncbi:sensor histidine kinase [Nocardioides xinjiangensis]|uniref:sensor histidine kinase n=1 Tax=Nocardioides xinjiangensis TaxID=2817376 RepID=UPI001B306259|nr:histidine kinase [Nocardioides sp. SYSU D00778]